MESFNLLRWKLWEELRIKKLLTDGRQTNDQGHNIIFKKLPTVLGEFSIISSSKSDLIFHHTKKCENAQIGSTADNNLNVANLMEFYEDRVENNVGTDI